MRLIRSILTFSLTVLLAALTWGAIEGALLIRSARRTVEAVPAAVSGELLETRKLLACQLTALRAQTLARVDRFDKADAQLTALRTDALVRVDQLTGRADAQLSTLNATATPCSSKRPPPSVPFNSTSGASRMRRPQCW